MSDNAAKCLLAIREASCGKKAVCLSVQAVADAAGLTWDEATESLAILANDFGLFVRFAGVDSDPDDENDEGTVIYQFFLDGVKS